MNPGGRLRLHILQRIALPVNAPITFLNEEGCLRLHILQPIALTGDHGRVLGPVGELPGSLSGVTFVDVGIGVDVTLMLM